MRYFVLAADYDGTLAQDGLVTNATVAALEKLRASGRTLILVTGRELDELLHIFPGAKFFARIVAENGALLYEPRTGSVTILAEAPPAAFVDALRRRNVGPISVGRVIIATWKPYETAVLETIRDMGLDLQVIFNKDAVMILPAGVTKATGLTAALKELELSPHEVVSIGDAENDHALLAMSECGVAVQNALPTLKDRADLVTPADHGRGVEQLIGHLLENDLEIVQDRLGRHSVLLGRTTTGDEVRLAPYDNSLLIAGPSGSGKSIVCRSFVERLREQHYQFCIIDPQGNYKGLDGAVSIGNHERAATVEEIGQLLKSPEANVVVNLAGLTPADRQPFFIGLLSHLQAMRGRTGRPHWIVVDAAHLLLSAASEPAEQMVFITDHPEQIVQAALKSVTKVLAVGSEPEKTIQEFCRAVDEKAPHDFSRVTFSGAETQQVVFWPRNSAAIPMAVHVSLPVKVSSV